MQGILTYRDCTACQVYVAGLMSRDEVTVTVSGAADPIWAIFGLGLGDADAFSISSLGEPLSRLSTVQLTRNSVSVTAPQMKSSVHGGPGPQILPVTFCLYLWASDTQKVTLRRTGSDQPSIGFVFGHAESVGDWNWITDSNGLSIDWPGTHS
jgi:hypothetical protein